MLSYLKKLLLSLIILSIPSSSWAVFNYKIKINCGTDNCSGTEDYGAFSTAENVFDGYDITDTSSTGVKCGLWDNQSGSDIADETAVTWDSGSSSGTLVHMTNHTGTSEDYYMVDVTTGSLTDNDVVSDGTNTFDVAGTPDSCRITFVGYDDDGAGGFITIDGGTYDSTHYLHFTVADGEWHEGDPNAGWTHDPFSTNTCFTVGDNWVRISRQNCDVTDDGFGIYENSFQEDTYYYNNLIRGSGSSGGKTGIKITQGQGVRILNNSISGFNGAFGICIGLTTNVDTHYIVNNSCYDNDYGIQFEGGNDPAELWNNISCGSDVEDFDTSGGWTTGGYNASGDTSSDDDADVTTGAITSVTCTDEWTDPANADLSVKNSSSQINDAGDDRGTTPTNVNLAINNRDRDAQGDVWDIGAWECTNCVSARRIWMTE